MTIPTPKEIKKRRINLELTQQQFSSKIGIAQGIISKFESGKNLPGYLVLNKIVKNLEELEEGQTNKAVEIMKKKVIFVSSKDSIKVVINIFKKKGFSQLPVIDNGKVVGLITSKNILGFKSLDNLVCDYMEGMPPLMNKEAPLPIVRDSLKYYPVVLIMEEGKIIGIVTRQDVLYF
tara:strand:+ start:318 stop:848 length:531 start_codon:yes stop_codon:yes gene_type:complete